MAEQQRGIFEGVRILEFGLFVAGPWASEMFAHGGADIVKIEPTSGDATRFNSTIIPGEGRHYIIKARGKRGVPLNLSHPEGAALARRMALASDVVISNMRQGALARRGLDYGSLSADNPRIIVGEISAFGTKGPLGNDGGADPQASAASGMMMSSSSFDGDEPQLLDAFPSDFMAGTLLAFGVASALYERERTGRGQHVATSLYQAGLVLQHANASIFDAIDSWKRETPAWVAAERPQPAEISKRRRAQSAIQIGSIYETADGRWFALGSTARAMAGLLGILGVEDPSSDPAWQMPDDPRAHFQALRERLRAEVRSWSADDLQARLREAGIPNAEMLSLEEAMQSEQAEANDFVYTADHKAVGPYTMPEAPVQFSAGKYKAARQTPAFGEHLREVLHEYDYTDAEIDRLIAEGAVAEELP